MSSLLEITLVVLAMGMIKTHAATWRNAVGIDFDRENRLGGTVGASCAENSLNPPNLAIDDSDSTKWKCSTSRIEHEAFWFYEFAEAKKITEVYIKYWTRSKKWNIEILAELTGGINTVGLYSLPSSFRSAKRSNEAREASIYIGHSTFYEKYIVKYVNKDPDGGFGFGLYNVQMFEEIPIKERIQTTVGVVKTLVKACSYRVQLGYQCGGSTCCYTGARCCKGFCVKHRCNGK